jgi:hypothetical protein
MTRKRRQIEKNFSARKLAQSKYSAGDVGGEENVEGQSPFSFKPFKA